MLLFRSIQAGWKTAGKSDRLLLLFYLASLVYASIAATSLYWVGRTELNFSLTGASLAGRFDLSGVLEFMLRHYDFLVGSGAAIIGVVGLYMLLSVFFPVAPFPFLFPVAPAMMQPCFGVIADTIFHRLFCWQFSLLASMHCCFGDFFRACLLFCESGLER